MGMPTPTTTQITTPHTALHNIHQNVKAFGAVGNGVADDTAAIQAAISAAVTSSSNMVFFPAGTYKISSTISLDFADSQGVALRGTGSDNPNVSVRSTIQGDINGPLFRRSTSAIGDAIITMEDLTFRNTHAGGTGVELFAVHGASGISHCWFTADKGVTVLGAQTFSIKSCTFIPITGGVPVGSWGIYSHGHTNIHSVDIVGFDHGIRISNTGISIIGGRIEVNRTGIMVGQDDTGATFIASRLTIAGLSFEANDTAINLNSCTGAFIGGLGILGSGASPSGGSLIGISTSSVDAVTVAGVLEVGSHATNFIWQAAAVGLGGLSLIGVVSTTTWNLNSGSSVTVINCRPEPNRTGGVVRLESDISPSQLVANTDNWNPTNLATAAIIRLSTDATRDITGIQGGADGRVLKLMNVGSNAAILKHDVTSTAANRFLCPGNSDYVLGANESLEVVYDSSSSRWRL